MSPYPPPSPVLLNQRAVSYSVFSVMRESVSFQVCPEFIRTIIRRGRGPRSLGGRQGGRHGEGTQRSEVFGWGGWGEIEFEIMFKMPVAPPVVDYNFEELVREQKITGPSHTCTFFFPPSSVSNLFLGSSHTPIRRSTQRAQDVWQFSDGSSRALKF